MHKLCVIWFQAPIIVVGRSVDALLRPTRSQRQLSGADGRGAAEQLTQLVAECLDKDVPRRDVSLPVHRSCHVNTRQRHAGPTQSATVHLSHKMTDRFNIAQIAPRARSAGARYDVTGRRRTRRLSINTSLLSSAALTLVGFQMQTSQQQGCYSAAETMTRDQQSLHNLTAAVDSRETMLRSSNARAHGKLDPHCS